MTKPRDNYAIKLLIKPGMIMGLVGTTIKVYPNGKIDIEGDGCPGVVLCSNKIPQLLIEAVRPSEGGE